nr:cytochrome b5 domain-containing protein [Candidatus Freyarchaeota archaeon]
MRVFTRLELEKYDGKNGRRAYVAYGGKVYDVTDSFLWQNGNHQALHSAGGDLTSEIEKAPHGDEFIKRFPVVGVLEE